MDIITILEKKKKYIKMLYVVGLIVLLLDVFLISFLVNNNDLSWAWGLVQLVVWFLQIVLFILEIVCLINFSYSKNRGYTILLIINVICIMISLYLIILILPVGDLLSLVTLIIL